VTATLTGWHFERAASRGADQARCALVANRDEQFAVCAAREPALA
jgi:hypothetical protein